MRKSGNGLFNKVLNTLVNTFMEEEEVEITDNGLDEVDTQPAPQVESKPVEENKVETKETSQKEIKEEVKEESKEKSKAKNPFSKQKTKTLEEDLFKQEELNLMEEMKSTPFQSVEIIEFSTPAKSSDSKEEFKRVASIPENVTEELTAEQKEAEEFHAKLDAGEVVIKDLRKNSLFREIETEMFGEGFEAKFFELMDAIEDNSVLERQEKAKKMNQMLSNLLSIDIANEGAIYDYFVSITHELHKAKNYLGAYNADIRRDKDLQNEIVLEYKISEIYQNGRFVNLLNSSDKAIYEELQGLVGDMYARLKKNIYVSAEKRDKINNEYKEMLLTSNSRNEIMTNIQILKNDLHKLENGIGEFSKIELVF